MLLLGVLLAASLVTVVAVLVSCVADARVGRSMGERVLQPDERARFEALVAPLRADPDFGRIDR